MTTNAVHTPFNDRCIIRTTAMQLTHKPVTDMQTVKSAHYLFIIIMLMMLIPFSTRVSAAVATDSTAFGKAAFASDAKGNIIMGKAVYTALPIYNAECSDDGKYLCIQTREATKKGIWKNKGSICMFDSSNMSQLWETDVKYNSTQLSLTNHGLILTYDTHNTSDWLYTTEMRDLNTGQVVWRNELIPIYYNDSLNIVIGYEHPFRKTVKALNLSDGNIRWINEIPNNNTFGWTNPTVMDGTKLVVVNNDIYVIDMSTGRMNSAEADTSTPWTKGIIMDGLAGLTLTIGAMASTGTTSMFMPATAGRRIFGLNSNVVTEGSRFYISDRNRIYCFDHDMHQIWNSELPDKSGSNAYMTLSGGRLRLLNHGLGMAMGYAPVKSGQPFIAEFDAATGRQLSFRMLADKKEMVVGTAAGPSGDNIVFDNMITHIAHNDTASTSTMWDYKSHGRIKAVLNKSCCALKPDGTMFKMPASDCSELWVITEKDSVFVLNQAYDITGSYPLSNMYVSLFESADYSCVEACTDKQDFWLVKSDGTPYRHFFEDTKDIIKTGDKIIAVKPGQLVFLCTAQKE